MVKKIFAYSYIYLIMLFLYLPILYLIVFSFTDSQLLGQWSGFSGVLYVNLFKNEEIMKAFDLSLLSRISLHSHRHLRCNRCPLLQKRLQDHH